MRCARCRPADSLQMGLLLAAIGGFLDAHTYVARGGVFANVQTGNLVLLGLRALEGDARALHYLLPVFAFVLGVALSESLKAGARAARRWHWRQAVLALEALALVFAAFAPAAWNDAVNAGVSFACAMQVNAFRAFEGNPYATTMCTGNLRSGAERLWRFLRQGEGEDLRVGGKYFAVIGCFMLGAGIGGLLTQALGFCAALFPAALLLLAAWILCRDDGPAA